MRNVPHDETPAIHSTLPGPHRSFTNLTFNSQVGSNDFTGTGGETAAFTPS